MRGEPVAQRSDARSALPLDGAALQGDAAACTWSASAAHSGDRGAGLGSSSCPAGCAASEPFPRKVRAETLTCAMLSCYARFPLSVLVCADAFEHLGLSISESLKTFIWTNGQSVFIIPKKIDEAINFEIIGKSLPQQLQ